jgi:hypothetical protein
MISHPGIRRAIREGMQMQVLLPLAMVLSLTSLAACSSESGSSSGAGGDMSKPEPIDLADYDRACAADADCVLATSGDVCRVCTCPDSAINKTDEPAYKADVDAAAKLCEPLPVVACGPCIAQKAACSGAVCVAVEVN